MGIILGIIGIFLLLMLCVMWILNVSPEVAFFISLAICIIMIIYNSFKEKNSDSNYKSNRNNKKEYLKDLYEKVIDDNEEDEERKNILIEEFIDFFEKEKISSDLSVDEVKSLVKKNGYLMTSPIEKEALNIAIKKYRGINFKENNISDKEKEKISKILEDYETKNNIKYFYHSDITNAKKVLKEHNLDMDDLDNIAIFEEIVNQFNIDNKENIEKNVISNKKEKDIDKSLEEARVFFKGQTLKIKINDFENSDFNDGSNGEIIYFDLKNTSSKRSTYEFTNFTIITKDGNEKEYDCWLNGFDIHRPTILSDNYRQGAIIFKHNNTLSFKNGSKFIIDVNDITNSKKYNLMYILDNGKWKFLSGNVDDIEKELTYKELEKELKNNIERIESLEEQVGITLENISINVSENVKGLDVVVEIIKTNSEKEKLDFTLNMVCYDEDNSIIDARKESFYDFDGYDVFKFSCYDDKVKDIRKIRIFVKE